MEGSAARTPRAGVCIPPAPSQQPEHRVCARGTASWRARLTRAGWVPREQPEASAERRDSASSTPALSTLLQLSQQMEANCNPSDLGNAREILQ